MCHQSALGPKQGHDNTKMSSLITVTTLHHNKHELLLEKCPKFDPL